MELTGEIELQEWGLLESWYVGGEGRHYKTNKVDLLIHKFLPHVLLSSSSLARWKSRGKLTCKEEHEWMHITLSKQFSEGKMQDAFGL